MAKKTTTKKISFNLIFYSSTFYNLNFLILTWVKELNQYPYFDLCREYEYVAPLRIAVASREAVHAHLRFPGFLPAYLFTRLITFLTLLTPSRASSVILKGGIRRTAGGNMDNQSEKIMQWCLFWCAEIGQAYAIFATRNIMYVPGVFHWDPEGCLTGFNLKDEINTFRMHLSVCSVQPWMWPLSK